MFTSEMRERNADTVSLHGVTAAGLEKVLEFIYSGKIVICLENINDIIATASHLQVVPIIDFCNVSYLYKSITW